MYTKILDSIIKKELDYVLDVFLRTNHGDCNGLTNIFLLNALKHIWELLPVL